MQSVAACRPAAWAVQGWRDLQLGCALHPLQRVARHLLHTRLCLQALENMSLGFEVVAPALLLWTLVTGPGVIGCVQRLYRGWMAGHTGAGDG